MRTQRIGRVLLSLGAFCTGFFPVAADWNTQHTFSPGWSPHARYHGCATIIAEVIWSIIALWLLWSPATRNNSLSIRFAALIPIVYWGAFFPALFVPTIALEDKGFEITHFFGIPGNLFFIAGFIVITALGYWLYQHSDATS